MLFYTRFGKKSNNFNTLSKLFSYQSVLQDFCKLPHYSGKLKNLVFRQFCDPTRKINISTFVRCQATESVKLPIDLVSILILWHGFSPESITITLQRESVDKKPKICFDLLGSRGGCHETYHRVWNSGSGVYRCASESIDLIRDNRVRSDHDRNGDWGSPRLTCDPQSFQQEMIRLVKEFGIDRYLVETVVLHPIDLLFNEAVDHGNPFA